MLTKREINFMLSSNIINISTADEITIGGFQSFKEAISVEI